MGAMIKFLQAVRRLAELGVKKEDIIEFGKREFGEMTELLSKQVDDIYKRFYKDKGGSIFKDKKPESGTKKPAEVIELKKQRPIAKDEFEKMLDETFPEMKPKSEIDESIELEKQGKELSDSMSDAEIELRGNFPKASDDQIKEMLDETFPGMKPKKEGIVSIVDETKEISKGLGEIKNETNLLPDSERLAKGFPSRSVEAIVRTGARELLVRKGIEVGEQDPIDLARQIFGEEVLEKLDNVADEMMTAQSFSDIGKILEREKIVDMQPRKGLDVSKSDELEKITKFDETDRKPNAEGGLNYLMGL
jgi:hypothetical protein